MIPPRRRFRWLRGTGPRDSPSFLFAVGPGWEWISERQCYQGQDVILDPALEWTSSNPAIAEVDGMGLVRARTPGTTVVRAEFEGLRSQVEVDVVAGPSTRMSHGPHLSRSRHGCFGSPGGGHGRLIIIPSADSDGSHGVLESGGALTDEENAYAAWLVGLNTVELGGSYPGGHPLARQGGSTGPGKRGVSSGPRGLWGGQTSLLGFGDRTFGCPFSPRPMSVGLEGTMRTATWWRTYPPPHSHFDPKGSGTHRWREGVHSGCGGWNGRGARWKWLANWPPDSSSTI